jgi:hypothetical protein
MMDTAAKSAHPQRPVFGRACVQEKTSTLAVAPTRVEKPPMRPAAAISFNNTNDFTVDLQ